ncbi:MAG: hypothetical protein CMK09_19100 [Ponticaulis sp.]|nr:hypothetical protein [Ponticaulis sp.]
MISSMRSRRQFGRSAKAMSAEAEYRTRTLASDVENYGIRFTTIYPSLVLGVARGQDWQYARRVNRREFLL